ncbi:hypothetical protein EWM64_g2159 [Hericium alpestre]|uniref:Polyketide synthase phosphopantetheine-binding domain-containing protein n=1 Tax=Hericium alpestre TaxID=135208 RepID=A0A4Z0A497_9AGAM|nr:hypothetical protein EWM64_g2159 [Hericium alpestre]
MVLGCTPFPISVRNSAVAVAHLVKAVGVKHLIVSPDMPMQRLSIGARGLLDKDGLDVHVLPMVEFDDLFPSDAAQSRVSYDITLRKLGLDQIAIILHSSGSTSFPKPVKITSRNYVQWGSALHYGEVEMCGMRVGVQSIPLFHAIGVLVTAFAPCAGITLVCFKPSVPPIIPTAENILESIVATKYAVLFTVPSWIEAWAQNSRNLSILRDMEAVIYAGAPLDREVGNTLVAAGVNLTPCYGATEVGVYSAMISAKRSIVETWEYFRWTNQFDIVLRPQESGIEELFESIVVESDTYAPNVVNATVNGKRAYETNDLVQRHAKDPELWRVYGRTDDQIMLSTGEKTNPGPIESILLKDRYVAAALMFGRGKFQNGVLITPAEGRSFDPKDGIKLEAFRNAIWPSVEKANEAAPAHSRLFKEVIIVTHPSKPFEYTAKGSPGRQVSLKLYDKEIEALYDSVAEASQTDLIPPSEWTSESSSEYVREVVHRVLKISVEDEDESSSQDATAYHRMFSLQATWIRNSLSHAIRTTSDVPLHLIPSNLVYSNPSIRALARLVLQLAHSKDGHIDTEANKMEKIRLMQDLLLTHTANLPVRHVANHLSDALSSTEVVLLTGTTGRLGCFLLAKLLQKPDVEKVYALNRGAQDTVYERQRKAFVMWGLDPNILDTDRLVLLAANVPHDVPVPERLLEDASMSVGNGYGESKWVAERMLQLAAEQTGLPVTVVRVGQLAGDSEKGFWNIKEWVPALVHNGQKIGALPTGKEDVAWLPVDVAASALLQMLHSKEPVLHLVHPHPVGWDTVFGYFSTALDGLSVIPYSDWVSRFRSAETKVDSDSTSAMLTEFFETGDFSDAPLSMEKAVKVSQALRNARPLQEKDVINWIEYWKKVGFLR